MPFFAKFLQKRCPHKGERVESKRQFTGKGRGIKSRDYNVDAINTRPFSNKTFQTEIAPRRVKNGKQYVLCTSLLNEETWENPLFIQTARVHSSKGSKEFHGQSYVGHAAWDA